MRTSSDLQFIIAVCRGIVRDTQTRRRVLFFLLLAVMLLIFTGVVILNSWLNAGPVRFVLYWGACLWLTLTVLLLALYDLLAVRQQAREEYARGKIEMLKRGQQQSDDPKSNPGPQKPE